MSVREVDKSPVEQGIDEEVDYVFNWASVGTPSSPTITIFDSQRVDKTDDLLSGDAGVSTTYVTCPTLSGLTEDETYTLKCLVTVDGNKLSGYMIIKAKF